MIVVGGFAQIRDQLTAEPHLSSVQLNVTSGVCSGNAVPGARDSVQHGDVGSARSSDACDPYVDRRHPLVITNGAERSSSSLGTGRQSRETVPTHENHIQLRDTQP